MRRIRVLRPLVLVLVATQFACGGGGADAGGGGSSTTAPTAPATTQLSIWADANFNAASVTVNVDGVSVGLLTQYFNTTPNCGQTGTLTIPLSAGDHVITAFGGGKLWAGVGLTLASGKCNLYRLPISAGRSASSFSTPDTFFAASQNGTLQNQCAYRTETFTLGSTKSFDFRFAAMYKAQAAIMPASQLAAFQSCAAFTGYDVFDGTYGRHRITLGAGDYVLGVRNMQSAVNGYGYELDYATQQALLNPEAGFQFAFVDFYVNTATLITKGARYVQPFSIQEGMRYFLDGVNSGTLECFIIPSNQQTAFLNGQSFSEVTGYHETGGFCPGLDELKIPVGDYAIAIRNTSGTVDAAVNIALERWKIN